MEGSALGSESRRGRSGWDRTGDSARRAQFSGLRIPRASPYRRVFLRPGPGSGSALFGVKLYLEKQSDKAPPGPSVLRSLEVEADKKITPVVCAE